jgi:threonine/homoserine/homoserine lactone efflux protein
VRPAAASAASDAVILAADVPPVAADRTGLVRVRDCGARRGGDDAWGFEMTWSFLLTTLIVVASPGTGVLYTLAVALTRGSRASVAAAFGCTLGIVPQMIAAMLGLAAILHTSALAFAALKWGGVVYLLYMAWQALRERGALAVDTEVEARSSRRVIVTAILINILNPKLSIFFLAFLPQFIAVDEPHPLARMVELSGVFMAMTFAVFAVYGLFAASVRDRVITRPKAMAWLRRSFAAGFALLGAKLAFAER